MGQERDFVEKFWIWIPDTCGKAIDNILNQNDGLRKKKIRLKWYINWTVRHIFLTPLFIIEFYIDPLFYI